MRLFKKLRVRAALAAMVLGTGVGAFLMPMSAYASDGENGAVYVELPQGWQNKAVTLLLKSTEATVYTDNGDTYTSQAKLFYAAFDDESYKDITDVQSVTIDHNCLLKIKAIYDDGNTVYNSYEIKNFDLEAPTVTASIDGEILYLSASDQISGVKDINVNGKAFTELGAGQMCVNIKDLQADQEYLEIHSDDVAGNMSKQYKIRNPYYVGQIDAGQEDQSLDNPDSVEATDPTRARGTVSDDTIVKDGDASREFYTVTASGKTFYLIVDKTTQQDNVYLLTEAGVNDLLNFVDYNGVDVQNGDVPMYEIPVTKSSSEPEIIEDEPEEEPVKEDKPARAKSNPASMFVLVVIACVGAVGYYFLKNKKRREDLEEAEEMDSYDIPDEENENELTETEGDDEEETDEEESGYEEDEPEGEDTEETADESDDEPEKTEESFEVSDQDNKPEIDKGEDDGEEPDDIYIGFVEDAPQTGLIDDIQGVEFYDDIPEEAVEGMDITPEDLVEEEKHRRTHRRHKRRKRR